MEGSNRGILLIKWNTSTKDVWAIDRTGDVFCSGVGTDNTLIIDASPVHAAIEIRPTTPPCTACLLPSDRNIQNEQSEERRRWGGIFLPASYKKHFSACSSCYRPFPPLGRPFAAPFEFGFLGKGRSSIAQTYFCFPRPLFVLLRDVKRATQGATAELLLLRGGDITFVRTTGRGSECKV